MYSPGPSRPSHVPPKTEYLLYIQCDHLDNARQPTSWHGDSTAKQTGNLQGRKKGRGKPPSSPSPLCSNAFVICDFCGALMIVLNRLFSCSFLSCEAAPHPSRSITFASYMADGPVRTRASRSLLGKGTHKYLQCHARSGSTALPWSMYKHSTNSLQMGRCSTTQRQCLAAFWLWLVGLNLFIAARDSVLGTDTAR